MRNPVYIWGDWLRSRPGSAPTDEDLQLAWPGFKEAMAASGYAHNIQLWHMARPVKVLDRGGGRHLWMIIPTNGEKIFVVGHVTETTEDEYEYDEDDEDDNGRVVGTHRYVSFRAGGGGEMVRSSKLGINCYGLAPDEIEAITPYVDGLYEVWGEQPRSSPQAAPGEGEIRGPEVSATAEALDRLFAEASPEAYEEAIARLQALGYDPRGARELAEAARQAAREELLPANDGLGCSGPWSGVFAVVRSAAPPSLRGLRWDTAIVDEAIAYRPIPVDDE